MLNCENYARKQKCKTKLPTKIIRDYAVNYENYTNYILKSFLNYLCGEIIINNIRNTNDRRFLTIFETSVSAHQ